MIPLVCILATAWALGALVATIGDAMGPPKPQPPIQGPKNRPPKDQCPLSAADLYFPEETNTTNHKKK